MLSNALFAGQAVAIPHLTARRVVTTTVSERPVDVPEFAPVATRNLVRWIAAVGIVLTVTLSITDAVQLALPGGRPGNVTVGLLAAALAIPLHVRHLIYGMRGARPPAGAWTLAVLAIVSAAGVAFGGIAWLREFSLLAASIVIVIPGVWGFVLAAAVVVTPLFIVGTQWYGSDPMAGTYLAFVIAWRSMVQVTMLRLLAALRALDSANKELETRAVVQTRLRIDSELRNGVGAVLQRIVARGETAREAVDSNPANALAELRRLVRESRTGLTDARRVVRRYAEASLRGELDAAAALLEASGARVRIVVAHEVGLEAPNAQFRRIIRTAVADALLAEPRPSYLMQVTRDRAGVLLVRVAPDDGAPDGVEPIT